jgi:hypothetical protein
MLSLAGTHPPPTPGVVYAAASAGQLAYLQALSCENLRVFDGFKPYSSPWPTLTAAVRSGNLDVVKLFASAGPKATACIHIALDGGFDDVATWLLDLTTSASWWTLKGWSAVTASMLAGRMAPLLTWKRPVVPSAEVCSQAPFAELLDDAYARTQGRDIRRVLEWLHTVVSEDVCLLQTTHDILHVALTKYHSVVEAPMELEQVADLHLSFAAYHSVVDQPMELDACGVGTLASMLDKGRVNVDALFSAGIRYALPPLVEMAAPLCDTCPPSRIEAIEAMLRDRRRGGGDADNIVQVLACVHARFGASALPPNAVEIVLGRDPASAITILRWLVSASVPIPEPVRARVAADVATMSEQVALLTTLLSL